MVTLTKISSHGRTRSSDKRQTTLGHGMYTLVWGEGSKRQSRTMHCSEAAAESAKNDIKD